MRKQDVPKPLLARLPAYLDVLYKQQQAGAVHLSASVLAAALNLNPVLVRKDLAATGVVGKPKAGFEVSGLIRRIEEMLGFRRTDVAVLVGVGSLGRALLAYEGFAGYRLHIAAAFDADAKVIGQTINGTRVYPPDRLSDVLRSWEARIGIITVPAAQAQGVCDRLVDHGILAIWNFAPVHLNVPAPILVHNENMAASLALLSRHLKSVLEAEGTE